MAFEGDLQETRYNMNLLSALQSWEEKLSTICSNLESHINHHDKKLDDISSKVKQVIEEIRKRKHPSSSKKRTPVHREKSIAFQDLPSNIREILLTAPVIQKFRLSYDRLESVQQKLCLLCFTVFPQNAVVKKRTLIYWWIGEGLIYGNKEKTAEEVGEDVFQELIKQGLIKKEGNELSPLLSRCSMYPWMWYMLISLAQDAGFCGFDGLKGKSPPILQKFILGSHRMHLISRRQYQYTSRDVESVGESVSTVYNSRGQYLDLSSRWLSKCQKLKVLQLGRWQDSPKHHIEVKSESFLKNLGRHKCLKLLSLRGISKIKVLPDSILGLINLEILDLRACHHLEKLPKDIASLRKLTHLDVSECYLIERLPKGIEKLSSLQVLKGFVLGAEWKNPCKIKDLRKLGKLRRLSIYIGTGAEIGREDFKVLGDLRCLQFLTISWGIVCSPNEQKSTEEAMNSWQFPRDMEKLALIGMPLEKMPKCLSPDELGCLKKLYITGGKLASLKDWLPNRWKVQMLRLYHLKKLEVGNGKDILEMFPQLSYLERVNCNGEDIVWNRYIEILLK